MAVIPKRSPIQDQMEDSPVNISTSSAVSPMMQLNVKQKLTELSSLTAELLAED